MRSYPDMEYLMQTGLLGRRCCAGSTSAPLPQLLQKSRHEDSSGLRTRRFSSDYEHGRQRREGREVGAVRRRTWNTRMRPREGSWSSGKFTAVPTT